MQSLSSLLTILKLIITIVVLSLAALLMFTVLPIKGNLSVLTVLSGSMEPTIKTGSVVVIKAQDSYTANDVITFAFPGRKDLVTHRISAVNYLDGNKTFLTKGDANDTLDQWEVERANVKGKVWFSIPYLGYVQTWLRTPTGFVAAVVLPAAILIYGELMTIKSELFAYWRKRRSLAIVLTVVSSLGLVFSGAKTSAYLADLERVEGNSIGIATSYVDLPISPLRMTNVDELNVDVIDEKINGKEEASESAVPLVETINTNDLDGNPQVATNEPDLNEFNLDNQIE